MDYKSGLHYQKKKGVSPMMHQGKQWTGTNILILHPALPCPFASWDICLPGVSEAPLLFRNFICAKSL